MTRAGARTTVLIANPSPDVYGSDLQMLESISAMTGRGWRVIVAIPRDGELVAKIRDRGAEVEFFDFPVLRRANQSAAAFAGMAASAVLAVPRIARLIRRLRPDAVYVNTVTLPWWLLASRLTGTATICHLHEAEKNDSLLVRKALITPLRLAHAVIVISRSAMSAMVEADPGLAKKGRLIYNGVPTPPAEPTRPDRTDPLRVVVVGRLSPRKAPHLALEAVGQLREQGLPLEIELAGSAFEGYEWYVEQLEQRAAQPDLAGAVTLSGYCSPIWPALERADIVAAPSLREPFGNAVVEAQLSLRPVVATAALGHLESITDGETGLLVPAEDVDAMAKAIRRLVEDRELAETMAANARQNALARFTTPRYNAEITDLVTELVHEKRPHVSLLPRRKARHPKTVRILGTHGVPANYGGFETAAENVAKFLRDQGWRVVVYCQVEGSGEVTTDTWQGLERVNIGVSRDGWLGTSQFDWLSIQHAAQHDDICLTFGYNTAVFNLVQRLKGIPNVINMDGIEWSRARWGKLRQAILYTNERIGCFVGNHLIADHPEIETYLHTRAPKRKVTTVTYGAAAVTEASADIPAAYGLTPGRYLSLIARPIPENSILEIVQGFSARPRGIDLVILGGYTPETDAYHQAVMAAASDEVRFVGGIYDPEQVQALRFHSLAYVHGHTVGGTNPSLVEALGAGNPVIAHDNAYNRWVAQDAALYFSTADDVDARVSELVDQPELASRLSAAARARHASEFTWEHVAGQYEQLLLPYVDPAQRISESSTKVRVSASSTEEKS